MGGGGGSCVQNTHGKGISGKWGHSIRAPLLTYPLGGNMLLTFQKRGGV